MAKAMLFYDPRPQFFNNDGSVAASCQLFFYTAGTTTKKNTYTDVTKGVANPNPIILDSAGRPSNTGTPIDIYLDGSYKVVLAPSTDTDPPASPIWTVDNVNTLGQLLSTVTKTTNYTVTTSDRDKLILVDASGGAITITLPTSASCGDGFNIKIKKIDSSSNNVTITPNGVETIDGNASLTLTGTSAVANLITNGTGWYNTANNPNVVKQQTRSIIQTSTSTSTVIPFDNTIPQNTEGGQALSCSITPTSSSSILLINVKLSVATNAAGHISAALFQDSTANALAATATYVQATDEAVNMCFDYSMTAGTTSSTTFKVRIGPTANTYTVYLNSLSTALFGGVMVSSITVTELSA